MPVFQMLIASKPISCLQKSNRFGGSIRVVHMIKSKLNQLNVSVPFSAFRCADQHTGTIRAICGESETRTATPRRINILKLQAIKTSDQKRRFLIKMYSFYHSKTFQGESQSHTALKHSRSLTHTHSHIQ